MTFDELLRESKEAGQEAGEQRMLCLVSKMIENGESDAVSRLSKDTDFLTQMYEKYQI